MSEQTECGHGKNCEPPRMEDNREKNEEDGEYQPLPCWHFCHLRCSFRPPLPVGFPEGHQIFQNEGSPLPNFWMDSRQPSKIWKRRFPQRADYAKNLTTRDYFSVSLL
jgi:hypothetical protein